LLRYSKSVAEKACHAFASTTQVGLTQVLGPMRIAFCFLGLSLAASVALAGDPWSVNNRVFSCAPSTLRPGSDLQLKLAKVHGRELGVQRLVDNTWFFLVVASPPSGTPQLMSTKAFSAARTVRIPANYRTTNWGTQQIQTIFSQPGRYELYVSDNLESEDGGYKCKLTVRR
jgi:hypothetical protein